jgi:tripartite-type tricarboxylate transporter receptor subunit TctC
LSVLPDVSTFTQAGLPEFRYDCWFGILAPAGTPKAIVAKASRDLAEIACMPDVTRFEPGQHNAGAL